MTSKVRKTLEKRAQQAILQHAVFRWESAVIIALTLLLAVFTPLASVPAWGWLVGGLLAELAIIYSSLTDEQTAERVVENMLRDEFRPERLADKELQRQVSAALDYHQRIAAAARERNDSVLKDSLNETVAQIDDWIEEVYDLAKRLDYYRKEKPLLDRNLEQAQHRLQQLQAQLKPETAPRLQEDIALNIRSLERTIETMETLNNAMERAKLRLEHTLIAMGTIYSQTMLVGAKGIDSSRARRLQHEIAEEVNELGDILSAMDEVYTSSRPALEA